MPDGDQAVELRWAEWLRNRNRRGMRVALPMVIGLYPAFGLLDAFLAPRRALPWLLGTRALVTLVSLGLYRLVETERFDRAAAWLAPLYVVLGASGISFMTVFMGGLASPYYAGLTLYIVGMGLVFVWPARAIAFTHTSIVGSFVGVNAVVGTAHASAAAFSNLAFLSATALVAGGGQALLFRTQREQFHQRVRLEQTTARLERAHADLQELAEFKSRFFANMTHELRTPLAMVLAPIELVLHGEAGEITEAQRSLLGRVSQSALKLLKLIEDLLDLSRLEESRLRLVVEEHDLVAHLRALTDEAQVLARRKGIELVFTPDTPEARLRCDLERIERVFVNLVSNALKFSPAGGHVAIGLREADAAYEVSVKDEGPGFPPEDAFRIFERFYQVDMGGTRRYGGAGIGLALARELVLLHGGDIEARSDGRNGALFVVRLPKAGPAADASRPAAPPAADADAEVALAGSLPLPAWRDLRLLELEELSEQPPPAPVASGGERRPHTAVVVEDHAELAELIRMSLSRQFDVLVARDGLAGLDLALRERPSLVVTDLMMPGLDGLELTRRLRADPRTHHVPILVLSARGGLDDRVKGLETGASAYLTKPFSPVELVAAARQLVRAKEETADLVLADRVESLEFVAAGLAHEMNNPLNYVKNALARVRLDVEVALGLAREAASRALGDEERGRLERLGARAGELLAVADSGLVRIGRTVALMSRYGRAGFRREVARVDVWEAARTAVDVVLPATGRKVEVELEFRGDGTLECVPEELNQVITNLVQNAIEAAPEVGGRVVLTGAASPAELVLSVKDNGPGVPAEVQARLFTPFFTTKGPARGMGLGLTITRRIVQSMGGRLELASKPGAGAEFLVRVPRRRLEADRLTVVS